MFEAILYLLPLFALLVPLLRGRFLGEDAIARMRDRLDCTPRRRPARAVGAPRPAIFSLPRGGSLIAESLAVRPPPHAALT